MKKLIFVAILATMTMTSKAQVIDLGVLAGGVAYQKFVPDAKMDNVLHFWGGYFGTVAVSELFKRWDMPRSVQILIPPVLGVLAVGFKEYLDNKACMRDFVAGVSGVGVATIRIAIKF